LRACCIPLPNRVRCVSVGQHLVPKNQAARAPARFPGRVPRACRPAPRVTASSPDASSEEDVSSLARRPAAFPAARFAPFEEAPPPAAASCHQDRCPLAVAPPSFQHARGVPSRCGPSTSGPCSAVGSVARPTVAGDHAPSPSMGLVPLQGSGSDASSRSRPTTGVSTGRPVNVAADPTAAAESSSQLPARVPGVIPAAG